jgi:hypothetical protein
MAQTLSPEPPVAKFSTDDKGSDDAVASDGMDKAQRDLAGSSPMIVAPLLDEPVVTRKELWSYYSMFF